MEAIRGQHVGRLNDNVEAASWDGEGLEITAPGVEVVGAHLSGRES